MSKLAYLGMAYAVVWIAIAGYLVSIARRQRALEKKMEELKGPPEQ